MTDCRTRCSVGAPQASLSTVLEADRANSTEATRLEALGSDQAEFLEKRIGERRRAADAAATAHRAAEAAEARQEQELHKQLALARKGLDSARDALTKATMSKQEALRAAAQQKVCGRRVIIACCYTAASRS